MQDNLTWNNSMYECTYVCMQVCMHAFMHVYMYVMYVSMYVCMCKNVGIIKLTSHVWLIKGTLVMGLASYPT